MAAEKTTSNGSTADLEDLIHQQNDQLFDLRALLSGLISLSCQASDTQGTEQQQAICNFRRLAYLADKVAVDMQAQLEPHV